MEVPKGTGREFGSIEVPQDWVVDQQSRYAQTTKERALDFFDEKNWSPIILQRVAIEVRNNEQQADLAKYKMPAKPVRPIFFVTGGYGSYFWDNAKQVVVEEVKSTEQVQREFSGDMPEGKFFIKKDVISK